MTFEDKFVQKDGASGAPSGVSEKWKLFGLHEFDQTSTEQTDIGFGWTMTPDLHSTQAEGGGGEGGVVGN